MSINHISHLEGVSDLNDFLARVFSFDGCRHFSPEEKRFISRAFAFAQKIHVDERRKVSGLPYISHPMEIVDDILCREIEVNWRTIVVMLLHDVLESNPVCFRDIFDQFPIDIFFRVLKLSKISLKNRKEIVNFIQKFLLEHPELSNSTYEKILLMLSHDDRDISHKMKQMPEYEKNMFEKILEKYGDYLNGYSPWLSDEKKEEEIDGIIHYLYFDIIDAKHKYYDTIHNLSDVHDMESLGKEKYLTRRLVKLQILAFVLYRYNMVDELSRLRECWTQCGGTYDNFGKFNFYHNTYGLINLTSHHVRGLTLG